MRKDSNLIMGINTLTELLRSCPEKILEIYTVDKSFKERKEDLLALIKKEGITITYTSKKRLDDLVGSDSHQGFVAKVRRSYETLKETLDREPSFLVMLDQIYDPHNFGAILRSAECFGAGGLIYSKNKGCPVTPVVTKVSSGASELVPLIRVSNLNDTLIKLKERGYTVVIADCGADAKSIYTYKIPEKMVFILGSEEKGVSALVRKKADELVYLPMRGKIDSLNVSQAAACFFSYFQTKY